MRKLLFVASLVCFCLLFFIQTSCSAQVADSSCNQIYDGYIVRVHDNCPPSRKCNADYFFCFKKPATQDYLNDKYVATYTGTATDNRWLLNERYYEDFNANKVFKSATLDYYYTNAAYDSIKTKDCNVFVYRVLLAGSLKNEPLSRYIDMNDNVDNTSAFRPLPNTRKKVNILYPAMISTW